jgi:hypothetical protein
VLTELLARTRFLNLEQDAPPRRVESLLVRRHETLPLQILPH